MRRNCLRRLTQRSIRLRRLYASRSYSIGDLRFDRGGITGSMRSRHASGRALPDFDSPFYAGCMLVRPHDGGIDGMLLVGWWPKTRQGFECGIPHAELAPACEAHKDRIPIT